MNNAVFLPRPYWLPSASTAARSLQCPASVVLPKQKSPAATDAMRRGSYLHLYIEHLLTGSLPVIERLARLRLEQDDLADLHGQTCERIQRDDILRGCELVSAEEAFAYHPATDSSHSLGTSIERAYLQHGWLPTVELAGTADVILRAPSGEVFVGDFKTGHYDNQVSYSWQPQLALLALFAARAYGVDSISSAVCLVMDSGRIHWTQISHYDAFDLAVIAGEVSRAVESWDTAFLALQQKQTPTTQTGPWCDYCPSRPLCPAWMQLARELASGALGFPITQIADLDPSTAGVAWEKIQQTLSLAEAIERQLREYAKHRPLQLSDGSRLGFLERTRETIEGVKAAEYFRRAYSQAKLDEVSELKITKAALEKTFGREQSREILRDLRKQGAVKQSKFSVLDVLQEGK